MLSWKRKIVAPKNSMEVLVAVSELWGWHFARSIKPQAALSSSVLFVPFLVMGIQKLENKKISLKWMCLERSLPKVTSLRLVELQVNFIFFFYIFHISYNNCYFNDQKLCNLSITVYDSHPIYKGKEIQIFLSWILGQILGTSLNKWTPFLKNTINLEFPSWRSG